VSMRMAHARLWQL